MPSFEPRIDTRLLQLLISRLGELQIVQPPPPPPLLLPNLQPRDWLGQDPIEINQVGLGPGPNFAPDIEVLFHFANTGGRDSGPFEIEADVVCAPSRIKGCGNHIIQVNNLPAGAIATERITVLTEVPANFPVTVSVTVYLDKPTPDRPGGRVWESDETDNRAFGFLGFPAHVPVIEPADGP
jgi:hypothetical protein